VISWGKGEGEKLEGRKGVGRKMEEMRERVRGREN
jgi:hypothetical protein